MIRQGGSVKSILFVLLCITINASATWLDPREIRNDLAPSDPRESNLTESEFRARIKELQDLYSPLATNHGGKLNISGDWKSDKLNAGATQTFGGWQVKISGALARRPELTKDAFSLILCHELGHHFGGFVIGPAQTPFEKPWAANEGQADYFSTQVCARKLWVNRTDENAEFRKTVTAKIQKLCDPVWESLHDQNLCYRILTAVESLTTTMAALTNKPTPDFETPDTTIVNQTNHRHPVPQCRMDTATQGGLCLSVFNDSIIPGKNVSGGIESIEAEKEAASFSCTAYSEFKIGLRPTCWFKPRL